MVLRPAYFTIDDMSKHDEHPVTHRFLVATTWEDPGVPLAALRSYVQHVPADTPAQLIFVVPDEPSQNDAANVTALLADLNAPQPCAGIGVESVNEAMTKPMTCVVIPHPDAMATAIMMNEFLECVQQLNKGKVPCPSPIAYPLPENLGRLSLFGSQYRSTVVTNPASLTTVAAEAIEQRTPFIAALQPNDPRISVGRYTYGGVQFHLSNADNRIEIGSFCSIATDVMIFGGGEHMIDWITTFPLRLALGDVDANFDGQPHAKGPTVIGNDVWIATGATIMSGVTIGDGAVIGARAVVAKNVAPYAIVVGNPAREVRKRFDDVTISRLLRLKWWDWPIDEIRNNLSLLCGGTAQELFEAQ